MKRFSALPLLLPFASCMDQTPSAPSLAPDGAAFMAGAATANGGFSFTTIEVPNARSTWANGINAGGDIVGEYTDAAGRLHGYLLRNGVFTTIDYPGAARTQARGIGSGGEIVGTYQLAADLVAVPVPTIRGFLRTRQGEFVTVMFPGHRSTIAQRILPDGTILGCRHNDDTMASMKGVVIARRGNSEIEEFASMHNGATPDGRRIAGLWTNMMTGRGEGYVIDDGEFKSFMVPGSIFTAAWDVNSAGDVVGVHATGAGTVANPVVFHGFVRTGDEYASIDVPEAVDTRATGINARGDVVGRFTAGGKTRGFLARRDR